jgi:hypothetical protein
MPSVTPVVFLSSRFAEFRPIRQRIKKLLRDDSAITCKVVDLEENYPDHDPPWMISQDAVRSADIMILLVGTSYGTIAPGQKHSYIHLEYEAACTRGSKTAVLPYFFDDAPHCDHPGVRKLCDEISKRHTYSQLSLNHDTQEIAFEIVQHVQRKAFSLLSAATGGSDIGFGADEESDYGDLSGSAEEDRRIETDAHLRLEPKPIEKWSNSELLGNPARAAAAEQKRLAAKSLALGEWRRAVWHLDQSRQRDPWDLPTLFWSARLKLISGRRDDSRHALALAVRAARVAEKEIAQLSTIPLSASYILAARAAGQLNDPHSGVEYAQRAVAAGPQYWFTHYELAKQYACQGDGKNAAAALRSTFYLRPTIWLMVKHDATFARCRRECDDERRKIDSQIRNDVKAILQNEARLWTEMETLRASYPSGFSELETRWIAELAPEVRSEPVDMGYMLMRLLEQAKRSFTAQVDALKMLAKQAQALEVALTTCGSSTEKAKATYSKTTQTILEKLTAAKQEPWDGQFDMDSTTMGCGSAIAALLGMWAITAWGWWGVLVPSVLLVVSCLWALSEGFDNAKNKFTADKDARIKRMQESLDEARKRLHTDVMPIHRESQRIEKALADTVHLFVRGANEMEEACLKRRIYCATPPLTRAAAGDLVLLKPGEHSEEYTLDNALLPESLVKWEPYPLALTAEKHLYRLLPGVVKSASRKLCYFSA